MHDKNNNLLAVGDKVTISATILEIASNEGWCNVTLETVEPMFPDTKKTCIVLNSKQVEKEL